MKRIIGLDIVRTIAIIFVFCVHFFLNNGFYTLPINGIKFIPILFFRTLFFTCVPLFIILTGYLKKDKKLDKNHYKSIIKIIISYLFISIISIIFKSLYLHESFDLLTSIISIFNFTAIRYSWYVEMYLGLFILIPFLNVLYNNLETKKNKQFLILTLALLIGVSPLINFIEIKGINLELIPNWWDQIYPLLYYFIGCYIKEYKLSFEKKNLLISLFLILLISSVLLYIYNFNKIFSWNFLGGYNCLIVVIISTIIFLILYDVDIKNNILCKIFNSISLLSFDIYLFAHIPDTILYSRLFLPLNVNLYIKYFFMIVPISFLISYLLSYFKNILFKFLKFTHNNMGG